MAKRKGMIRARVISEFPDYVGKMSYRAWGRKDYTFEIDCGVLKIKLVKDGSLVRAWGPGMWHSVWVAEE